MIRPRLVLGKHHRLSHKLNDRTVYHESSPSEGSGEFGACKYPHHDVFIRSVCMLLFVDLRTSVFVLASRFARWLQEYTVCTYLGERPHTLLWVPFRRRQDYVVPSNPG